MDKSIVDKLIELNKKFYTDNADDFSVSRNKYYWNLFEYSMLDCKTNFFKLDDNYIYIFGNLTNSFLEKEEIRILDLGSGNGRFLEFLLSKESIKNKKIKYIGTDFSKRFLELTKDVAKKIQDSNINFSFEILEVDITDENQMKTLESMGKFDLIVSIAVMHHIPSKELRVKITNYLKTILSIDGRLFITTWDFVKSNSKLIVKPEIIGFKKSDLEINDYILTWKKSDYRYLCLLDSSALIS
ncbi:MAG: class I SAM-dependent methyltransferase [bacterium]